MLSSGRPLGEATGTEAIAEGGWIAEVGRRAGKRKVKDALTLKEVLQIRLKYIKK